ncbi:hypothetical protein JFL47_12630 [Haemophilus haemoglobinophilus]|nr:hypothetical protein [Canicola haemoglobinophilus]
MLNLLKRPIEAETLDAWAKWLEDIAKVSIIAVPVVVFGQYPFIIKTLNILFLLICTYFFMLGEKLIRKHKDKLSKED